MAEVRAVARTQSSNGASLRASPGSAASLAVNSPPPHRILLLVTAPAPVPPSRQSHAPVAVLQDGGFQCSWLHIISIRKRNISVHRLFESMREPGAVDTETRKLFPRGLFMSVSE
ncbi:unnamed protein product [Pleuronectes platessa]|uniref:Uncharacterized protein n=1 Tax=Pleuronectes platessa TaxID=8262 RepID=A0A9N7UC07_PLEPL|nr:unnamed protein product [Pleuronectes platessa]